MLAGESEFSSDWESSLMIWTLGFFLGWFLPAPELCFSFDGANDSLVTLLLSEELEV
jgi:hypothetical protein